MTIKQLLKQVEERNIPLDTVIKTNDTELFDNEPYFTWIPEAKELVIGPYKGSKIKFADVEFLTEKISVPAEYYETVDINLGEPNPEQAE